MILLYQVTLILWAIGLVVVARRVRGPTGLIFAAMSLLSAVVPLIADSGLQLVKYDEFALLRRTPDEDIALIVSVALLGTLAGYAGVAALNFSVPATPIEQTVGVPRRFHSFLRWSSAAMLLLALLLASVSPGGIVGVVKANLDRVPQENSLSSILYVASIIYGYLVMALLISSVLSDRKLPKAHLLCSLIIFWSMGGRVQFASILISYVLLLLRYKRLKWVSVILIAVPAAFMMNLILVLRLSAQGAQGRAGDAGFFRLFDQLSMIGTYDLAMQYVREHGYNPLLYPSMLIQLIPRGLLPGKPLQISRIFRYEFFHDNLGGIPPGLWGEFVISGDLPGVLVLAALFGALIGLLDVRVRTAPRSPIHMQALYFSLIPVLSIFAVRGGLDNSIFRIATVAFAALLLSFVRRAIGTVRSSERDVVQSLAPPGAQE